jgi:phage portal protein BeeE
MAGRPAPKVEQDESQRGYYVGDFMSYMAQFGSNAFTVTPSNCLKSCSLYSIVDRKASTIASLPIKIIKKDVLKKDYIKSYYIKRIRALILQPTPKAKSSALEPTEPVDPRIITSLVIYSTILYKSYINITILDS